MRLVAALSLGIDLGFGQPMEHVLRQCLIALRIAELMGLDEQPRGAVYYTALLINVGCHTDAHEQAYWFGDDIAVKATKYGSEGSEGRGLHAVTAAVRRWPWPPEPRWPSPTPARTASATRPPASIPWRSASARDGPGSSSSALLLAVIVAAIATLAAAGAAGPVVAAATGAGLVIGLGIVARARRGSVPARAGLGARSGRCRAARRGLAGGDRRWRAQ